MESTSMCRCCATEGSFKDIKNPYYWMGEEEVYGDMLRECFDVKLTSVEQGGICEVCITQLRNASNFKKQVLNTEEQFKKHLNDIKFKATIVKEEVSADEDNDKFDSDDNPNHDDDDEDYVPEFEIPIKTETIEAKPKKRASTAKATTSRAKKTKTKKEEDSKSLSDGCVAQVKSSDKIASDKQTATAKTFGLAAKIFGSMWITNNKKDLKETRHNSLQILRYSNSTPIRAYKGFEYYCAYCKFKHTSPSELKKHTLESHADIKVSYIEHFSIKSSTLLKYDLTNLKCNLCDIYVNTMEQFLEHIKLKHNKEVYSDAKNQILPFKFETEQLTCFICNKIFGKFKYLLEHVNTHYNNFVCNICSSGFVTSQQLRNHLFNNHRTGTFPCPYCPKVLDTERKRGFHLKRHNKVKPLKCWYCDEKFSSQSVKEKHLIEKHGMAIDTSCKICNNVYPHRRGLQTHIRRVHLYERRFKCTNCDMSFFSHWELKDHSKKHSDLKVFECDLCNKRFARKPGLQLHMRKSHQENSRASSAK